MRRRYNPDSKVEEIATKIAQIRDSLEPTHFNAAQAAAVVGTAVDVTVDAAKLSVKWGSRAFFAYLVAGRLRKLKGYPSLPQGLTKMASSLNKDIFQSIQQEFGLNNGVSVQESTMQTKAAREQKPKEDDRIEWLQHTLGKVNQASIKEGKKQAMEWWRDSYAI